MRFILVGHYAGKNIEINGCKFANGEFDFHGELKEMDGLVKYLRTYNAHLAGSPELAAAQELDRQLKGGTDGSGSTVSEGGGAESGVPSDKSGAASNPGGSGNAGASPAGAGSVPAGDGVSPGRDSRSSVQSDPEALKILEALTKLDPEKDDNWTDAGLAKVSVIEDITGIVGVGRKDIDAVLPGWNRDKAIEKKLSEI